MKEMRRIAEEKRKLLHNLESEESGNLSEKKKRKVSKSKNGKGVKNTKKTKGKAKIPDKIKKG